MTTDQILPIINEIFKDVLDNDAIVLNTETTAQDVEEWDSLTHIQLVVAVEKKFKVKFKSSEIQSWKKVGDMCAAVQQHMNKQ